MWLRANVLSTASVTVPTVPSTVFGVYLCQLGQISIQNTAHRNLISKDFVKVNKTNHRLGQAIKGRLNAYTQACDLHTGTEWSDVEDNEQCPSSP